MKLANCFVAIMKSFLLAFVVLGALTVNAQTFTVFPSSSTAAAEGQDSDPLVGIETGMKFKVTQIGTISAIRFYKYSGNGNATYRANLWTNSGSNLSTGTAVISGAGWQQIDIPDVVLTPGNVYVVSVYSPTGFYSVDIGYFPSSTDINQPPFIVLAANNDPAGVGNGVYSYGLTSTFPSHFFNSSNYWVDLVFTTMFTLPVSLSDFKAVSASSDIALSWKTQQEYSNKGFEIERSNNGSDWYAINFINSAGDGSITRNYSYTDKSLAPGAYYYRLKQTDLDGKINYSSIVSATITGKGKVSLSQNYPNPFINSTTIRFDLPNIQRVRLSLLDMSGREVKVLTDKTAEAGSHIVSLNASGLLHQSYIVQLQTEEGVLTKKITVQ